MEQSMQGKLFIVLTVLVQPKLAHYLTATISGKISNEDVIFIHKVFQVEASTRVTIEVDLSYPKQSLREYFGFVPTMGIYTTQDHINIKKRCTDVFYGQLDNRYLHSLVQLESELMQSANWLKIFNPSLERKDIHASKLNCYKTDNFRCKASITIQDFKLRKYSFSFGYYCYTVSGLASPLKGLAYNMSIYATNETNCFKLNRASFTLCYPYVQYGVLPNLYGYERLSILQWRSMKFKDKNITGESCYQHKLEIECNLLVTKCDPQTNQLKPPCREMCYDYSTACRPGQQYVESRNCNYLPSLYGDLPCLYKPARCRIPPYIENATLVHCSRISCYATDNFLHDTVEYSCDKEFKLEGNSIITCMYSGEWSTPPQCRPVTITNPLVIVLPVIFIPLVPLFLLAFQKCRNKMKTKCVHFLHMERVQLDTTLCAVKLIDEPLLSVQRKQNSVTSLVSVHSDKRKRTYDAFVLYHFDSDNDFVADYLLPELEETRDLNLCIHSRNFTPGRDIKDNIEEAIASSNSAIIVISQGFVDSIWCKEEFVDCYIENMKDPAFNLFVIMMQPADTLVNISNYMKTFFANKTYLHLNDTELFTKLARNLQ